MVRAMCTNDTTCIHEAQICWNHGSNLERFAETHGVGENAAVLKLNDAVPEKLDARNLVGLQDVCQKLGEEEIRLARLVLGIDQYVGERCVVEALLAFGANVEQRLCGERTASR